VQSEFQKDKFIKNGIPGHKITIVPGLTPEIRLNKNVESQNLVSFVGRVSMEKGIEEFIEAAKHLPAISFAVAGSLPPSLSDLKDNSPANIRWTGFLSGQKLDDLYQQSQIIVIPGKWYEGFPNVITRAMKHGKPVITSNLGAMASIIDHQKNGLLVEPGSATYLAKAIQDLYNNPERCKEYGIKGKQKAEEHYSSEKIYTILKQIYTSLVTSRSNREQRV
jgi:glycosyltransferase involved in cell wall biosynthesis